jgi:class 3 adenylate cyclase
MLDTIKNNLNDKKLYEDINLNHQDELNLLNIYINKIIDNAETDKYNISQEKIKYKNLLENFIPHNIAKDFNNLGGNISKNHDNIAILSIKISGISHLIQGKKNINKFSELFDLFKQLEVSHEIDKLTLVGNNYIISCRIHKPRIDYARRCVIFSIELFKLVKIFNQEENLSIGLQIGIHSGSIVSGIIGSENFIYSLWGDPINIANDIHCKTEANTLIITQSIYNQLVKKDSFKKYRVIDYPNIGNIITWQYTDTFK